MMDNLLNYNLTFGIKDLKEKDSKVRINLIIKTILIIKINVLLISLNDKIEK